MRQVRKCNYPFVPFLYKPFSPHTRPTSSVTTTGGGWAPDPSGNPSKARPNTVASRDVVKRCAELAAKAREITGPACTSAELRSSTWTIEPSRGGDGERLAYLNGLSLWRGCLCSASDMYGSGSLEQEGASDESRTGTWISIRTIRTHMSPKDDGHIMTLRVTFLAQLDCYIIPICLPQTYRRGKHSHHSDST